MHIIDTHCDVLLKLQALRRGPAYERRPVDFQTAPELDANFARLRAGQVRVQFFAVFVEPAMPSDQKWQACLDQLDAFHEHVLSQPGMRHIRSWAELDSLGEGETGAVLALEGADAIGNDLAKLRHLYRAGLLSLGLTWNNPNLCADGVGEPRGGGLTELGREVVRLNNRHGVLSDVAHLSEQGFWDLLEVAEHPIASHANARAVCDHPRNLTDAQARALFARGGTVHVVFTPPFVTGGERASVADVIRHIEHFCALGGVGHVGFGSDFDGIEHYVDGLRHAGQYQNLIDELLRHYSAAEVEGFAFRNFLNHRPGAAGRITAPAAE